MKILLPVTALAFLVIIGGAGLGCSSPTLTSDDPKQRESALILSHPSLEEIEKAARQDPAPNVRAAAVGLVIDQKLLEWVAVNDKDQFVRYTAVRRLENRVLLKRIASSDQDPEVRVLALWRWQNNIPARPSVIDPPSSH